MVRRTTGQSMRVSAEELASISSPSRVGTPFGEFEFLDRLPLPVTVERGYEALDLLRAVDVSMTPTGRILRWTLAKIGGPPAPAITDVTVTPVLVATRAERRRLIACGHPESHAGEALSTEQSLSEP